eukprot:gene10340-11446_t
MAIKEQFDHGGEIEDESTHRMFASLFYDYSLLLLVLFFLGVFFLVIMYILTDANADRVTRLDRLKKQS